MMEKGVVGINLVDQYIYMMEASRWVSSIAKKSGKPESEVQRVWKETEKEIVSPLHKGGITDKLSQVSRIVKHKTGVKSDDSKEDEGNESNES